jgi:hypothetical protein
VCVCVCVCVCARVRACVRVCVCVHVFLTYPGSADIPGRGIITQVLDQINCVCVCKEGTGVDTRPSNPNLTSVLIA